MAQQVLRQVQWVTLQYGVNKMTKDEEKYKNQQQTDDYPFDYSLAEPTDMQRAEEMRVNPYENDYANFNYEQTASRMQKPVNPVPNPVPDKVNGIDLSNISVPEVKQYNKGDFIPPYANPKTYDEVMANWNARDEYDKQKWSRAEKWRTIGEAILGAGEIAARALSGASGQNVMPQYMAQQNAQGLDELKYLRQKNKERFMQQIALMEQDKARQMQLANQERAAQQWAAEFGLKEKGAAKDAEYKDAMIGKAKEDANFAKTRAGNYPAEVQSRIRANNARATQSYASANKANSDVAKAKSEQSLFVGGKQYTLPKGMNIGNLLRAVQNRLSQRLKSLPNDKKEIAEKYITQKIDKYHDDSYNGIASIINATAHDFPDITQEALNGMSDVKVTAEQKEDSSTGTGSWGNSVNRKKMK